MIKKAIYYAIKNKRFFLFNYKIPDIFYLAHSYLLT